MKITKRFCYVYLLTELNGITDNVTKIQRQKSSTKFYNLINQNTVISNKNINSYLNLHKTIPVNYNRRTKFLVSKRNPEILKSSIDVPPNTPSSQFFSFFLSLVFVSSLVSPLFPSPSYGHLYAFAKIHEIDSSRTFLPHVQNESSRNAREASINRY